MYSRRENNKFDNLDFISQKKFFTLRLYNAFYKTALYVLTFRQKLKAFFLPAHKFLLI
jgi:hypothetical protein